MRFKIIILLGLLAVLSESYGKSEEGVIDTIISDLYLYTYQEQRPLLKNTKIYIKIECLSENPVNIEISWNITERHCYNRPYHSANDIHLYQPPPVKAQCMDHNIILPEFNPEPFDLPGSNSSIDSAQKLTSYESTLGKKPSHPLGPTPKPIFTIRNDGIYLFEFKIRPSDGKAKFKAPVRFEFLGPHGYISATDWPLLPFYLIMCFVYVLYGLTWLVVSFMQWRDLLRIQFWIGGVILLGMLEKAFFYAQYETINKTGFPKPHLELVAEFVSCAKRTLARMLVIIMSLGFGIVKPRLGPMLHRVVGVGFLYFMLACVESYLRIEHTKADNNDLLVASIPLAVLDTGICWWIFTSLVQTTRTLRLRRNMVKLSLYRHFTNTLIFAVIASVIFMLFALRLRKTQNCTPGWRDIWVDNAFWHILFSVLLLVIMILWRPTNNNQRYAFTPLLDNPEDEDDEEEEDQFVADAYGVKMRNTQMNGGTKTPPNQRSATTTTEEDDLRWVEENIPSSMADPALPILDSDEEIINTRFEVSKMQ